MKTAGIKSFHVLGRNLLFTLHKITYNPSALSNTCLTDTYVKTEKHNVVCLTTQEFCFLTHQFPFE